MEIGQNYLSLPQNNQKRKQHNFGYFEKDFLFPFFYLNLKCISMPYPKKNDMHMHLQ